jgi:hypothetical protein
VIVLSLGWGVQSFTLAAMAALGELPKPDAAVHADTTYERAATYAFAKRWTPWLQRHGVPVITVREPIATQEILTNPDRVHIPLYSLDTRGRVGQLRRSCTHRWKIVPMRRWLRRRSYRQVIQVTQWLGISLDEVERAKPSDVKYITHRWPLLDRHMTRANCVAWLQVHNLEIPCKSSCVFCPLHNRATWRDISKTPDDWQRACEVDNIMRHKYPKYSNRLYYLTWQLKPLPQADFTTPEDHGQLGLWSDECSGHCFL